MNRAYDLKYGNTYLESRERTATGASTGGRNGGAPREYELEST
jgi:hypothetical protein